MVDFAKGAADPFTVPMTLHNMGCDAAAAADRIVAQPGTLTGGIGVADGKLDLTPALKQLGVNVEAVSVGKHALMESYFTGITKQEHRWSESMMNRSDDCNIDVC